ncbi:unnamed protein product [Spirodela intermedia]|uniref:Uncharacterized protein n=1 Tax=Spirodela intermedia TaxID=51605 RepID=A0A7I8L4P5_SPIIN|nr:unnamed protein product [Spirodela intermedia]
MGGKGLVLVAAAGLDDDGGTGDGMQCSQHPLYGRANPGGICALCLQEKLGRLVSGGPAAKQQAYHIGAGGDEYSSHSPSSPPSSIRPTVVEAASAGYGWGGVAAASDDLRSLSSSVNKHGPGSSRSRMIPFLYNPRQKKKDHSAAAGSGLNRAAVSSSSSSSLSAVSTTITSSGSASSSSSNPIFKRSKSVAGNPIGADPDGNRGAGRAIHEDREMLDSPRKKSFWSFLHLHLSSHHHRSSSRQGNVTAPAAKQRCSGSGGAAATCTRDIKLLPQPPPQLLVVSPTGGSAKSDESTRTPAREAALAAAVNRGWGAEERDDSPGSGGQASISSFSQKVARSRSVGCGSRSFSGEFLERISSGFGDCALRRVESQRESKAAGGGGKIAIRQGVLGEAREELSRQRVRCGGIFGGFSSTSSSLWLSEDHQGGGRPLTGCQIPAPISAMSSGGGGDNGTPRARRIWAWAAFSSPMRAFSRLSSKHAAIASVNGAAACGSPSFKSVSFPAVNGGGRATTAAATAGGGAAALLAVRG